MRISGWFIFIVIGAILIAHPGTVRAVEEGQFVKEGREMGILFERGSRTEISISQRHHLTGRI